MLCLRISLLLRADTATFHSLIDRSKVSHVAGSRTNHYQSSQVSLLKEVQQLTKAYDEMNSAFAG